MSHPRHTGSTTRQAAFAGAGRVLAAMQQERDELYVRGGAEAVAEAAYVPGGPSKAELVALYERLRAQAKRGDDAGH